MQKITGLFFSVALIGLIVVSSPVHSSSKLPENTKGLDWQWRYDQDGRLEEITAPGNVTTRMTYMQSEAKEGKDLTTTIATGSEKRKFKRDFHGRLLSAEGSGGTIAFSRNAAGLPTEVRSDGAPTLYYKYNIHNRLAEMRIGKGTNIEYRYDYLGRPAAIVTPAGEITYKYERAANKVIRRLPNGIRTVREYNDEGKLIELTHVYSKNYIIAKYTYIFRPDGLIKEISEENQRNGNRVCRYKYNLMHRLTDVECGGKGRSYHYLYDSLGNLTESQVSGDQTLHFTSTPAGALATDSRGALHVDERGHIRKLPHLSASMDYDFNDVGELAAAKKQYIQYTYNALGLLTSRMVEGLKTEYLPDPFADAWQPLWRRDVDGTETVIVWDGAVPLVELRGKKVRYRLEDHLSSVRIDADRSGKIIAWHDYTPYGAPVEAEADDDLIPAFAGLFWDPVAKVYLAKARAYDPITARFLQPDPQLRVPDASKHNHSLYAYSGGDPVNFVDRNGAEAVSAMLTDGNGNAVSGLSISIPPLAQQPKDRPQEQDHTGEAKRWFVNTLNMYELKELQKPEYEGKEFSELSRDQRVKVRNAVVDRFGSNYADFPLHFVNIGDSRKYVENYRKYVANRSILTQDGWTSIDWTATNIQIGKFIPLPTVPRLYFGKWISNIEGPFVGRKDKPAKGTEFPPFVKNVAPLQQRLRNIDISYASAVFTPGGIMGTSIVASSMPLTTAEYRAWKSSRAQSKPSTPYTQGAYWNQFDSGGRAGGGPWGPGGGSAPGGSGGGPWGPGGGGSSISMHSPSPVGGVYLGGAGKMLEGLGQLKGIAVDEATGKLVLIGSNDDQIALPPLRLDDVVTVFRAVYDYGESPSVTIDPDEQNPEGPTMDVKHGPGTQGTYVGWILFECDRIMKTYQLGADNVTRETVISKIPGYKDTLDAVYFGGKAKVAESKGSLSRMFGIRNASGGNWERFWIVPASVRRFDAQIEDLSLFELPLKVNTQKMRWEGGKLVDDEAGESSFGANAFKTWFSKHYDEIADEVLLTPPPDSGFEAPVAIFHELRRIALIAAIAERLRESGETMPTWMRDYSVTPFPVSKITPSLTVEKTKEDGSIIHTSTIYGGVNLAPADKDVYTYSDIKGPDTASVPKEHVAFVDLSIQEAASLKSKIPELVQEQEAVGKVQALQMPAKKTLSAAILPGADTRALAPNRQQVSDLVVPIGLGRNINLTRYYNSFFDPVGEFGTGWTFDLPRLLMTKVPVKRDGKRSQYRVVPHLISPLGTVDIRFDRTDRVEPNGVEMLVAKDHPEVAGVVGGHSTIVGANTHQVLFRDGTEWHFDDDSRLVLVQAEGSATRYIWDSGGRVRQVVGYIGPNAVADIKLGYDPQGRVIEVKAQQADYLKKHVPAEVSELAFQYGEDGRLSAVISPGTGESEAQQVEWTYSYEANHLSQIAGADDAEVSFGYDERGRLLWEKQGSRKKEYSLTTTPQGTMLTNAVGEGDEQPERWTYDVRMRPVEAKIGGGKTIRWRYGQDNEVSETLYRDDKPILTRSMSQDGRTETTTLADGPTYEVRRDALGHPTTLLVDGVFAAKATWRSDGRFAGLRTDNTEIQPLRHKDGWQNGLLISTPMVSGKTNQWLEYEWDLMRRPIKIADSSGFEYMMNYDEQGRINTFGRLTKQRKLLGANIVYNSDGLITDIESSWGKERREYASSGVLKSIVVKKQGAKSVTKFDAHGRQTSQSAFDNGETTWRYESDKDGARLRTIVLPNDEQISYSWDDSGETYLADISMGSAIVRTQSDAEGRVTKVTWGGMVP